MTSGEIVQRFFSRPDARIHYRTAGQGPRALVVLHGFPASSYSWHRLMPRLAERYTVIAPDLRGFGDSSRPEGGYDAFTMAVDVHALVTSLGFQRASVVGHDIGAVVAYAYAASFRGAVEKLVLLEGVLPGAGLEELVKEAQPMMWHFPFLMVPDLVETLAPGRELAFLSHFFRPWTLNPAAFSDDDLAVYARAYAEPGAPRATAASYRALPVSAQKVRAASVEKLTIPVLSLAGEGGLGNPALGSPAKAAAERIAVAPEYRMVAGAGHWLVEEQPAALLEVLTGFLG